MACWMRALAGLARCERPVNAPASASSVQPGRLEHGPDEKFGLAGLTAGAVCGVSAIFSGPPRPMRLALGRDVLRREIRLRRIAVNGHSHRRNEVVFVLSHLW